MIKHFCHLFSLFLAVSTAAIAQMEDPVRFETKANRLSNDLLELTFSAKVDKGWHVYATDIGSGGPTEATFHLDSSKGAQPDGALQSIGQVKEEVDPIFQMPVRYFEGQATFVQRIRLTQPEYVIQGYLEYGACNDQNCLPPTQVEFQFSGKDGPQTSAEEKDEITDKNFSDSEIKAFDSDEASAVKADRANFEAQIYAPVIDQLQSLGEQQGRNRGLITIFLLGFVGGLLALLTPCVWPIIPMTVSFFLHRSSSRSRALREASLYGLSIVVIYLLLGLIVTLLFGASALNALSTNALFNLFFFALLVLFAISFLGGFELTLPSSWNNKINQKADSTTGLLSIFLMAFTLALVSFSCTGPIIGFLLVEVSTMGSIVGPAIGMFGFALALALPFSLFALFPSWLKKMPKSGGWMNCVKVSLGFIELAFALKFLSVADLAYGWHILDRETFLSLWIALSLLLGLYYLGLIRFAGDEKNDHLSIPRCFLALSSFAFAIYMVPGLWGAPLKAISAFSPPLSTQDFNLYKNHVEAAYNDYEEGLHAARATGKPMLIDFTGLGCVNCRKMENSVWTDERVRQQLTDDFILVSLFVDDKTPLPSRLEVEENGTQRILRTIGDKWSYLQRHKFGANTQPFYVILNEEGQPLNHSYAYDENVDHFLLFLQKGKENHRKH